MFINKFIYIYIYICMFAEYVVLSFAASAAAVGHCDRVRITSESNPVQHSVLRICARHFQDNCSCLGCNCIRLQRHLAAYYVCM